MTLERKLISSKVYEHFGGDPRVVASLPEQELQRVQNEVAYQPGEDTTGDLMIDDPRLRAALVSR